MWAGSWSRRCWAKRNALGGRLLAIAASRSLQSRLFGIQPLDLYSYAGAALLLGAVAVMACAIPARRATLVDPVNSLRTQ